MYFDPQPHLPGLVVLDAPNSINRFRYRCSGLEHMGMDIQTSLSDIFEQLRDQEDAEYNLALSGYEMYSDVTMSCEVLEPDVTEYVNARDSFGKDVFACLREMGLYINGVLHYQLKELHHTLMVLEKLQLPLTDHELRQRELARKLDFAVRGIMGRTTGQHPAVRDHVERYPAQLRTRAARTHRKP